MKNDNKMEITEGSEYKVISLGGRDNVIETEGIFKGFVSIGVDETGLLVAMTGDFDGNEKLRIIPLHVVLAIDIINLKENEKKDDDKQMSHYVG